mmetsp:Transcript_103641/g.317329  ORF Transcript_103641/g.317329 Transcript_103641/m.317329 type:complete len:155 (-) Transcript_103641:78-542(-)
MASHKIPVSLLLLVQGCLVAVLLQGCSQAGPQGPEDPNCNSPAPNGGTDCITCSNLLGCMTCKNGYTAVPGESWDGDSECEISRSYTCKAHGINGSDDSKCESVADDCFFGGQDTNISCKDGYNVTVIEEPEVNKCPYGRNPQVIVQQFTCVPP